MGLGLHLPESCCHDNPVRPSFYQTRIRSVKSRSPCEETGTPMLQTKTRPRRSWKVGAPALRSRSTDSRAQALVPVSRCLDQDLWSEAEGDGDQTMIRAADTHLSSPDHVPGTHSSALQQPCKVGTAIPLFQARKLRRRRQCNLLRSWDALSLHPQPPHSTDLST